MIASVKEAFRFKFIITGHTSIALKVKFQTDWKLRMVHSSTFSMTEIFAFPSASYVGFLREQKPTAL